MIYRKYTLALEFTARPGQARTCSLAYLLLFLLGLGTDATLAEPCCSPSPDPATTSLASMKIMRSRTYKDTQINTTVHLLPLLSASIAMTMTPSSTYNGHYCQRLAAHV